MKNTTYILCVFLSLLCMGCPDDDDTLPKLTPEATGTLVAPDGKEYPWVRYNGLDWMAENYKGGTPYYEVTDERGNLIMEMTEDITRDFELYGNLLTYEEAVASAPEGWRLPTDEDWKQLEQAMGMAKATAEKTGWRGSPAGELLQQDETGIRLLLGGMLSLNVSIPTTLEIRYRRVYGYYWTSTTIEGAYEQGMVAWYRRIRATDSDIERASSATTEFANWGDPSPKYMSVRYVRDAQ